VQNLLGTSLVDDDFLRHFAFAWECKRWQYQDMDRIEDEELKCYSAAQAAELLGVSEKTVRTLIKDGQLKSLRVGSRLLIRAKSLSDFLDQSEVVA
tara:strand:+ start:789 stop:1076 length:288 start_codon:yes stop_codon:yes gene_type:complete